MNKTVGIVLLLCLDDEWVNIQPGEVEGTVVAVQGRTNPPLPRNLDITTDQNGFQFSWERPLTDDSITGYDVTCFTGTTPSKYGVTLSLSVDGSSTSAYIVALMDPQYTNYRCCVTAHIQVYAELSPIATTPLCDDVSIVIPPLPTASTTSTNSILVPVLGILAGLFLLALLIVSVALVLFMISNTGSKHKVDIDLSDQKLEEIPE